MAAVTRPTDVAIVGGGLAGSLSAAMLGRAGFSTVMIDPHPAYPPDFRCEKLDGPQMRVLEKTGLAGAVLRAATPDRESWVARFGRLVEKRPGDQNGITYADLVNTVRAEIPSGVEIIHGKVKELATSADRQSVTLANGDTLTARLVVLANGLNIGLQHKLAMSREVISACHSISIGFDVRPAGRTKFGFPAITHYSEKPSDCSAYITLFPIGSVMRANLFVYRGMDDPWLRRFRETPQRTLYETLPGLQRLMGDFEVTDRIQVRPVDLYVTRGHRRAGIVLVGDAFATSCPAAGTGARKVLNDAERLCNVHVPQWLATPGMGEDKIAAFYDDPVKKASDAYSAAKAFELRSLTLDTGLTWAARRWVKFAGQFGRGALRQARARFSARSPTQGGTPAASGIGR